MDLYAKTDNSILLSIGLKIKESRLEMNITQKELSEKSGISTRAISDIERGGNYTLLSLIALLRALSLLNYLDMFFQEKQISPIEYAKLIDAAKIRKRATSSNNLVAEEELGW